MSMNVEFLRKSLQITRVRLFASCTRRRYAPTLLAVPSKTSELVDSPPRTFSSSTALSVSQHEDLGDDDDFLMQLQRASQWNHGKEGKRYDRSLWEPEYCKNVCQQFDSFLYKALQQQPTSHQQQQHPLLSPENVTLAFKTLLKCHWEPEQLSVKVRAWEQAIGRLGQTPLTDHLSLRLLTANGKAGNVGRVLALLKLRRSHPPRQREFVHAITSIRVAQAIRQRNIFLNDSEQQPVDNPTRWLDAILFHMHERDFPLSLHLANRMLLCYAAGYTGKALHHFYRVKRKPVIDPLQDGKEMPHGMLQSWDSGGGGVFQWQPIRVQLDYNRAAPPFYKKPAQVRGKMFEGKTKHDLEKDPTYSVALTAAWSFAESLKHGACGHDPIPLDTTSYNALIQACVQRGALWRAMHLLDAVMPSSSRTQPNTVSFNWILAGLARVGDVTTAQEYSHKMMLTYGLRPDAFTIRAIVDGLLNLGDVAAAITVVQDMFNQHSVLPPYTTHLKIIEICLARSMVYEAKRHVYFLQQLWHWQPNEYHDPEFVKLMAATQRNTQLHKEALVNLFLYFGERLDYADFL